jgi:hypothetical protein
MSSTIISTSTKTFTVGYAFPSDPLQVGDTYTRTYAMISLDGREPREYEVTAHAGCEGYLFTTMEMWSNDTRCTGCDHYHYHSIGD